MYPRMCREQEISLTILGLMLAYLNTDQGKEAPMHT